MKTLTPQPPHALTPSPSRGEGECGVPTRSPLSRAQGEGLGVRVSLATLALILALGAARGAVADGGPAQSGAMTQVASSGHIYIAQPVSDSLFVRDRQLNLLTVLAMPAHPTALAADPARRRVYVASDDAGMISVIDDRTYQVIHIYPVGGHPDGLALSRDGKTLLISDGVSGAVQRFSPLAARSQPQQLFTIGPGAAPGVEMAPQTAAMGGQALAWSRGFSPHEPVAVYWVSWGTQPLARVRADAGGFVNVTFQVPMGIAVGQHLVILYGKWSTTSQSGLLDVVPAPPPPKRVKKVVRVAPPSLLQRLLVPSFVLPFPAGGAAHPKHAGHGQGTAAKGTGQGTAAKGAATHAATAPPSGGTRIPALYVVAVLPVLLLMILRMGRKRVKARKARKAELQGKKGKKGAAPRPAKKAA